MTNNRYRFSGECVHLFQIGIFYLLCGYSVKIERRHNFLERFIESKTLKQLISKIFLIIFKLKSTTSVFYTLIGYKMCDLIINRFELKTFKATLQKCLPLPMQISKELANHIKGCETRIRVKNEQKINNVFE